eukprot:TRINITY_DN14282_c0_g2_i1.p1 TRINITY_DN14282_c0_g2~~TRINITY_DN14282_c0_g2_i1.p1  ORF type:complete len:121 (+),score=11.12 TRINITY_DN14282_c0_g2_i1:29-364(+)
MGVHSPINSNRFTTIYHVMSQFQFLDSILGNSDGLQLLRNLVDDYLRCKGITLEKSKKHWSSVSSKLKGLFGSLLAGDTEELAAKIKSKKVSNYSISNSSSAHVLCVDTTA